MRVTDVKKSPVKLRQVTLTLTDDDVAEITKEARAMRPVLNDARIGYPRHILMWRQLDYDLLLGFWEPGTAPRGVVEFDPGSLEYMGKELDVNKKPKGGAR